MADPVLVDVADALAKVREAVRRLTAARPAPEYEPTDDQVAAVLKSHDGTYFRAPFDRIDAADLLRRLYAAGLRIP